MDLAAAVRRLRRADPILGRLMTRAGRFEPNWRFSESPYQGLFRSIVYQQLSGKAASTILRRTLAACGDGQVPPPERLLTTPEPSLRAAGLSRNKLAALRDLAAKTLDGTVPDRATANRMSDEDLIAHLAAVRGVGRWTAEMLLMFVMGRPDVLPTSDLGIRKGFMLTYGMKRMPAEVTILRKGKAWAPFRTIASWYLWRALELD